MSKKQRSPPAGTVLDRRYVERIIPATTAPNARLRGVVPEDRRRR
jgi:hypothetical protein